MVYDRVKVSNLPTYFTRQNSMNVLFCFEVFLIGKHNFVIW